MRNKKDPHRRLSRARGTDTGRSRSDASDGGTAALVVDQHTAFADLVAAMLAGRFGLAAVAVARTAADASSQLSSFSPAIVILNVDLPDAGGLTLLPIIDRSHPESKIIVIGPAAGIARVRPDPRFNPRRHAVTDIADGWSALARQITTFLEASDRAPPTPDAEKLLSPRELEVFTHIGRGRSSADIATMLGIGQQTVETHRKSVTKKLRATGAQLVRMAVLYVAAHTPPTHISKAASPD